MRVCFLMLGVFFFATALPAAAAAYKCNQNGAVIYSDKVCGEGAIEMRIIAAEAAQNEPPNQPPKSDLLRRAEEREAKKVYERRMLEIAREQKVAIGMEPEWVIESWGQPTRVNKGVDINGSWEQWIYRRAYKTQYVHFRNGKVVSAE